MPEKTKNKQKNRSRKPFSYKSFRLQKSIKNSQQLPKLRVLLTETIKLISSRARVILGILVIYGLLYVILVRGFSGGADIAGLKNSVHNSFNGKISGTSTAVALLGYLFSTSANASSELGAGYQAFLLLITSLAIIWTFRQASAGKKTSVRDAFYKGVYPLVTFIIVLLVLVLEFLPAMIGNLVYSSVVDNGLAVNGTEKYAWVIVFFLSVVLSLYLATSTIFALYIVTLPNVTPMKAMRSARALVLNRRWKVLTKLIGVPLIVFLLALILMFFIVWFIPSIAAWTLLLLSLGSLALFHAYIYTLYRHLL